MTCSNLCSIQQLKQAYLALADQKKVAQNNANTELLRLFYMGKELKNDLFLYSYDMVDGMVC